MMASFDYNNQNPYFFVSFVMQDNCYLNPTGALKLNNEEKAKRILVVVVKWRQPANVLLLTIEEDQSVVNHFFKITVARNYQGSSLDLL